MMNKRITELPRSLFNALLLALLISTFCLSIAEAGPDKGKDSGVTLKGTGAPDVKSETVKPQPHVVNLRRLCSWKQYLVAGFPKSGFCRWTDGARIGSACSCQVNREHAHEEFDGVVIEGPPPGGTASPVR